MHTLPHANLTFIASIVNSTKTQSCYHRCQTSKQLTPREVFNVNCDSEWRWQKGKNENGRTRESYIDFGFVVDNGSVSWGQGWLKDRVRKGCPTTISQPVMYGPGPGKCNRLEMQTAEEEELCAQEQGLRRLQHSVTLRRQLWRDRRLQPFSKWVILKIDHDLNKV